MTAVEIIAKQLVDEHSILSRRYNDTLTTRPGAYGTLEELRLRLRDMEAAMISLLKQKGDE